MSHSVHRLHMASVKLSGKYNPPTYEDTRMDVFAYLVLTGSRVVLVDTGIGHGNSYVDEHFEPQNNSIVDELKPHRIETSDVDVIINSHLHFDHCGNNQLFPNAEIFVQQKELEIARTTLYTVREWFDYEGARLNEVSGDIAIGDGIKILSTPGHTPGHQSVLIESQKKRSLIAAQAAFTADEYRRGGDPKEQAHEGLEDSYLASLARIKLIEADEVFLSHDAITVTPR